MIICLVVLYYNVRGRIRKYSWCMVNVTATLSSNPHSYNTIMAPLQLQHH